MTRLLRRIARVEIVLAMHLGTVGDVWAASAARRLGKLSGDRSGKGGAA